MRLQLAHKTVMPVTDTHLASVFTAIGLFSLSMISPGANFVMVVRSSLLGGRAAGVATGLGVVAGNALYASLGLFGLSALAPQGDWLLAALKTLGALYLIRLGLVMLVRREDAVSAEASSRRLSRGTWFRTGLLTDLANPQSIMVFAAIAAVSTRSEAPPWVQLASLAGILFVSLLWRVGLALVFSASPALRAYPRLSRYVNPLLGMTLLVLAGRILMHG